MSRKEKAFTLMELMIVVILIGIIAAFAIPNYQKVMNKAAERTVMLNLSAMRGAVKIYLAKGNVTAIGAWGNLAAVNAALGINLQDMTAAYDCAPVGPGGEANFCRAVHSNGWEIHFHDGQANKHCVGGACPSCANSPTGCGF